MFRSILVPLDGSPFAEQALPLAVAVARPAGAAINLVEVHSLYALNEPAAAWLAFDPAEDAAFKQQELAYLNAAGRRIADPRTPVLSSLVLGLEADGILEAAQARHADLVVMTMHGRGPVSRLFLGSVADEVVRRSPVPVLLLRPHDPPAEAPPPAVSNVLIPLDGSALAEEVLDPAAELARLLNAPCTLLRVIEAPPRRPAETHAAELPLEPHLGEARAYLHHIVERLHEKSVGADTRVVVAPHAAAVILEAAQAEPGTLIALAAHGRGGLRRMLLGSVADKLISRRPRAGPGVSAARIIRKSIVRLAAVRRTASLLSAVLRTAAKRLVPQSVRRPR